MDNYEFINTSLKIANDIPTMYQLGGWGQQSNGYYLFDCVCLIKSILWGFNFSQGGHGGAIYLANGVPDVGANTMIDLCANISYDFNNIEIGEILWLDGHVGIYVGERKVVEATLAWEKKVLISIVENDGVRIRNGYQVYRWIKHGKLPYVKYTSGYANITSFDVIDIMQRSVTVMYKTDLPITEVMYSLNNQKYIVLPQDNIISNLTPYTEYEIILKVKRKYTDNWSESKIIKFKTLDEPVTLKYKVDDIVILNGNIYDNPNSNNIIDKKDNFISLITEVDNHYGTLHPYKINELGWVNESDIVLYEKPKYNIFEIIKSILEFILNVILIPIGIALIFSIFLLTLIMYNVFN